jgi:anti-anti-sigma factor
MDLTIKKTPLYPKITLCAEGRITTESANSFEKELILALDEYDHIVVDMFKVSLLTSTGIRAILKTYKAAVAGKKIFQIQNPSEMVRNVLGLSNLELMLVK